MMSNSSASSENEQKPKRRPSLIRFGNRCRQMFVSNKPNHLLRSACYFLFVLIQTRSIE